MELTKRVVLLWSLAIALLFFQATNARRQPDHSEVIGTRVTGGNMNGKLHQAEKEVKELQPKQEKKNLFIQIEEILESNHWNLEGQNTKKELAKLACQLLEEGGNGKKQQQQEITIIKNAGLEICQNFLESSNEGAEVKETKANNLQQMLHKFMQKHEWRKQQKQVIEQMDSNKMDEASQRAMRAIVGHIVAAKLGAQLDKLRQAANHQLNSRVDLGKALVELSLELVQKVVVSSKRQGHSRKRRAASEDQKVIVCYGIIMLAGALLMMNKFGGGGGDDDDGGGGGFSLPDISGIFFPIIMALGLAALTIFGGGGGQR